MIKYLKVNGQQTTSDISRIANEIIGIGSPDLLSTATANSNQPLIDVVRKKLQPIEFGRFDKRLQRN